MSLKANSHIAPIALSLWILMAIHSYLLCFFLFPFSLLHPHFIEFPLPKFFVAFFKTPFRNNQWNLGWIISYSKYSFWAEWFWMNIDSTRKILEHYIWTSSTPPISQTKFRYSLVLLSSYGKQKNPPQIAFIFLLPLPKLKRYCLRWFCVFSCLIYCLLSFHRIF